MACNCTTSKNCYVNPNKEVVSARNAYYRCRQFHVDTMTYLQFGDLVFDGKRTVENYSPTFVNNLVKKPYGNGSFIPSCGYQYTESSSLSLTVEFAFIKMSRLEQQDYNLYIKRGLLGTKRIWAVDTGGLLVWAWASIVSANQNAAKASNVMSMSLEFSLPEGVWHIADLSKVYIEDYQRCDDQAHFGLGCTQNCLDNPFANCMGMQKCGCSMCKACQTTYDGLGDGCRFCNKYLDLFSKCQVDFRIVYNCNSTNPDNLFENFGQKIIQNTRDEVNGCFCSNTVLDTTATISLVGKFSNPCVSVNDESICITGEYKGILQIDPKGNVQYYANAQNGILNDSPQQIPLSRICYNINQAGFIIHSGTNVIEVTGAFGNMSQTVYIDTDDITY